MTEPTGYSVIGYGNMISDRLRMDAYAQALRQAVRPGCTVLDIGAGIGIFALLACQFGAAHVHAVEPNDAINVARAIAAANGYGERITFHPTLSTEIVLPAPVDVIISDLRGVLPLFQRHIPAIIDARTRLLAPGGMLIPRRDTLWAALLEDPETYRPYHEPWLANAYGLDLAAGQPLVANTWRKVNAQAGQLLTSPQAWAVLDYAAITNPDVRGEASWSITRAGTAHALLVWFDAELAGDSGFSNAPGAPELIYGQAFFPLQTPITLEPGDQVAVHLAADLTGDEYTWQWRTSVFPAGERKRPRVTFAQSTFWGAALSPATLHRREASAIPTLTRAGQADRFILMHMDGQQDLMAIAHRAAAEFPDLFAAWQDALTRAGELAIQYSR